MWSCWLILWFSASSRLEIGMAGKSPDHIICKWVVASHAWFPEGIPSWSHYIYIIIYIYILYIIYIILYIIYILYDIYILYIFPLYSHYIPTMSLFLFLKSLTSLWNSLSVVALQSSGQEWTDGLGSRIMRGYQTEDPPVWLSASTDIFLSTLW